MTFPLDQNISRLWGSLIIDELAKNGVKDVYCAPGMRNAPILAASYHHEDIKTYSFLDERALSFRALGNSKYQGNIPALTCTSGTAMANFLPAVIEAYRSGLPLIILTADRPIELVKIDANQTINQKDILKEFTCHTLTLDAPSESLSPMRLRSLISSAVGKAIMHNKPVHINIPLREPLDSTSAQIGEEFRSQALKSFQTKYPKNISKHFMNYRESSDITEIIKSAKRPLIVVGKLEREQNKSQYIKQLKKIDIPKYLDITSGIKFNFSLEDKLNPTFDHPEVFDTYTENRPDLIIHIGGRLVSKHYYRFQESNPDIQIVHITNVDTNHDPGFSNNIKMVCDPISFLQHMVEFDLSSDSPICWSDFTEKKRRIIEENDLSFPYISKNIIELTDSETELLIANSTAIRSFDSYISVSQTFPIATFSNRGVSGIEGFVATLCGLSDHSSKNKVLVLGDISFKHDINSLYMLADHIDKNLTIVVVNNYGGGIFELLPVSKEKDFLPLLTTPHEDTFKDIISSFKYINYSQCSTKEDFKETYSVETKKNRISIIEVMIDTALNKDVYTKLRTVKL
ncbi:MAG: 2-succinyl-5-enolpyruvyl-6-hydroxy-3-cyclohexene-1-carboxylic-acid synthase [Bacteriovorax sp. MedPE-SWde]|nr:MAG: 2-succinyl-5-enolpyruvyl-6-hydroxy-3-cyclohexene-1-carboxylic-acid synthase [Bacteriovorax sp. MedPE-SWde]